MEIYVLKVAEEVQTLTHDFTPMHTEIPPQICCCHLSAHRHSAEGWMYQQGPDDGTLLSVPGCWMPPPRAPTA